MCSWLSSLPQQQEASFLICGNFGQTASVLLPVSPTLVSACTFLSVHTFMHVPLILKIWGQELKWLLKSILCFNFYSFCSTKYWKGQVLMNTCLHLVDPSLLCINDFWPLSFSETNGDLDVTKCTDHFAFGTLPCWVSTHCV